MVNMEVSYIAKTGLKIKGKQATIGVDPRDKEGYNGVILLDESVDPQSVDVDSMIMQGPGEYEIGGIKISATRSGDNTVYSLNVDNVDVLVGKIAAIEKVQQKLKEHHLAVLCTDTVVDSSFATGLATNAVMFYGEKAPEVVKNLTTETVKQMPKYQTTREKLPSEMETILLA
jgi:hypothetical protein